MIEVSKYPKEYCFVGNPVVFEIKSDLPDAIEMLIRHEDQEVELLAFPYKKGDHYQADRNIADVLQSFFSKDLEVYGETVAIAPYPDFIKECTVVIDGQEYPIKAMNGGVSSLAAMDMAEYGNDIFSYRLNNAERSFLFTTRTNDSIVCLRESELFPFVFLHPGRSIYFVSARNNTITQSSMAAGTPCLMDLSYIRQLFLEVFDELTSHITIEVEGMDAFEIAITPSQWSEDMCWLLFRNSLGGYERIEITGKGYHTPEFSEDQSYQEHIGNGIFKLKRQRVEVQDMITIQTGYRNQKELEFLKDLIATDQAFLIYPDKRIIECIPSADSLKYSMRITEPTSVELKLKMVHKEKYHTPRVNIGSPDLFVWDGIWDDYGRWFDNRKIKDFINT